MEETTPHPSPQNRQLNPILQSGTVLGDGTYRLEHLLGKGGMGEVWLATHLVLKENRAIKFMLAKLGSRPEAYERFVEGEARNALNLLHPNIVRVHDLNLYQGMPYIVMEYVEGETLRAFLKTEPGISLPQAGKILTQLASAISEAHAKGIVHRDIKPANILLNQSGAVKLSDFGIAKNLTGSSNVLPLEIGLGTVAYMSPEQARGEAVFQSDQYSLGVVLYEMLTGRLPFTGESSYVIMSKHATSQPDPMGSRIPAEIQAVVLKALAKTVSDRYPGVAEFAVAYFAALEKIQDRRNTPTEVIELVAPTPLNINLLETTPNTPTKPTTPNNLPTNRQALIGREKEMEQVSKLLTGQSAKIVTLTGAGGTGKTLFALSLVSRLLYVFPDGVYVVRLENLTDAQLLPTVIIQELGIKEEAGQTPLDCLKNHLKSKKFLLILDTFEQIITAGTLLAELSKACPHLKLLVTSREALKIVGESEYNLAPLPLPDVRHTNLSSQYVSQFAAVELFVQRAKAVRADFEVTDANSAAIANICAKLDGLPLAIELAAGRVKALTPQQILDRLINRLKFLTSEMRDLPPRQRTMRGAIAWSYDALEAEEQQLFRRLAVFAGGCTLESAETVCDTGTDLDVLSGIEALVSKNLVRLVEVSNAEPRYQMLQIVREYALEKLLASPEGEEFLNKYAYHFLGIAEQWQPQSAGMNQKQIFETIQLEYANFSAVLDFAISRDSAKVALQLCRKLSFFWLVRGYWSAGLSYMERSLGLAGATDPELRTGVLSLSAVLVNNQGNADRAIELMEECLAIYRATGNKPAIIRTINNLAGILLQKGNYARSKELLLENIALSRELNQTASIAVSLNSLGTIARDEEDTALAEKYYEESLNLYRELGNKRGVSLVLNNLGGIFYKRKSYDQARVYFGQMLELCKELGDKPGLLSATYNLGEVAVAEEDFEQAEALLKTSLKMAQDLNDLAITADILKSLGYAALAERRLERAIRLLAFAQKFRQTYKLFLPPAVQKRHDEAVARLQANLDGAIFKVEWLAGELMAQPEAIAYALENS
jgi:predicted ATPase/Tfp pilus assembly protein PilF